MDIHAQTVIIAVDSAMTAISAVETAEERTDFFLLTDVVSFIIFLTSKVDTVNAGFIALSFSAYFTTILPNCQP